MVPPPMGGGLNLPKKRSTVEGSGDIPPGFFLN